MKTIKLKVKDNKYFIDNHQIMFADEIEIGTIIIRNDRNSPSAKYGGTWELLPEDYVFETFKGIITNEDEGKDDATRTYRMIPAGLPNITGEFTAYQFGQWGTNLTKSGAFNSSKESSKKGVAKEGASAVDLIFNANDGATTKGIYGNSNTVQPQAYRIYAWQKVAK